MSEKSTNKPFSNFQLIESKKALPLNTGTLIFNSEKFVHLHANRNIISFSSEGSDGESALNISFDLFNNRAISLLYCPYAGLSILKNTTEEELIVFFKNIVQRLTDRGIKEIVVKQPPFFIGEMSNKYLDQILKSCGFKVQSTEINHHINLMQQNYLDSTHPMQKRKIKKCIQYALVMKQESISTIPEIHSFITHCRNQTGLAINISQKNLLNAFQKLPDHYESFTIRNQQNQILAATVIVKINEEVVYNYLPAFDRKFKAYSPLTFLTYELVHKYKNEGYQHIDLGISSIDGSPQKSLITFKARMGAIESNRLVYHIEV